MTHISLPLTSYSSFVASKKNSAVYMIRLLYGELLYSCGYDVKIISIFSSVYSTSCTFGFTFFSSKILRFGQTFNKFKNVVDAM